MTNETTITVPEDLAPIMEGLVTAAKEGDMRTFYQRTKDIQQYANIENQLNKLHDPNSTLTQYMEEVEVNTAYSHVLNSKDIPTTEECFTQVMDVHGVTKDYIEDVKSNPIRCVSAVVDNHKNHEKQRQMTRSKTLDVQSLKKASTPNQLISSLVVRRSLNDRLEYLEKEVDSLKFQVDSSTLTQEAHSSMIEDINALLEIPKDRLKHHAKVLHDKGYSNQQIASVFNVTTKTVTRWLSSLKPVGE